MIKNIRKNLKTLKKIKSWSVGYTTSLLNKKRRLMSSQGAALENNEHNDFVPEVCFGPRYKPLNFRDDPDYDADP